MKKLKELKKKDAGELRKELAELRGKLQDFRFGVSGAKVKNVKEAKEDRKTIARILTLLKEAK